MTAICSIDITEAVSAEVSIAELISQNTAAGEALSAETTVSELITQTIQFEDSDL